MILKSYLKWLCVLAVIFQLSIFGESRAADEEKTFNEKIFERHQTKLPFLNEKNPKVIILFSGTTGMGKTWLGKQLENQLHGVRLSSDDVRSVLKKDKIWDEKIVTDYLLWSMKKVSNTFPNKLIILDSTIDRPGRYEMCATFAKNFGYEIFLVRLIADKDKVAERIKERGTSVNTLLRRLDDRWREYEASIQMYPADFMFDNREDSDKPIDKLIESINLRLDSSGILKKIQPGTAQYKSIRKDILNEFPDHPNMQEIIPGLYLGNEIAAENLDSSFTNILCFRSELPAPNNGKIIWKGIAIPDRSDSYFMPIFQETYDYIDNSKGNILVHCRYGRSRSPAIIIAYLMKKFDVPFDKAYRFVKLKRPFIEPNTGFIEELKVYEKVLRTQQQNEVK